MRAKWAEKTRERRGYGAGHKALRETYRRAIEGGKVVLCARCHRRILPGTPFDLGHTADRSGWTGAEHRRCNRATSAHRVTQKPKRQSRVW